MKEKKCQPPTQKMSALKTLREHLNLSQQDFASLLDTTVSTVSRWETGLHGEPRFTMGQMKKLEKILKKAGLKLSDLPDTQWGEIRKLTKREKIAV